MNVPELIAKLQQMPADAGLHWMDGDERLRNGLGYRQGSIPRRSGIRRQGQARSRRHQVMTADRTSRD